MRSYGMLDQVGGLHAVSIWSWVITLPLSVLIGSRYPAPPTVQEALTWTGALILIQMILALPLAALWVLLCRPQRTGVGRARPGLAVLGFALVGCCRAVLVQGAHAATGLGTSAFSDRLAVSVAGAVVSLCLIAIVTHDTRVDAQARARLESVRLQMLVLTQQESHLLREADEDAIEQVRRAVEEELRSSDASPERLREVAVSIVRPVSHALLDEQPVLLAAPETAVLVRAGTALVLAVRQAAPPSAVTVSLLVEMTVLPTVVVIHGFAVALANGIVGALLLLFGGMTVNRLARDFRSSGLRLAVIAVGYALMSLVTAVVVSWLLTTLLLPFPVYPLGTAVSAAGIATAITLWNAVTLGRQERQSALAETVAEQARTVEQLNRDIADRRRQASHFLHGTVQAELIAAALRGQSPDELDSLVGEIFARYGQKDERPVDAQVMGLIEAWRSVLTIELSVTPASRTLMNVDRVRGELLLDCVGEALSNVVRHSANRSVSIDITKDGTVILLCVTSVGFVTLPATSGTGLRRLRERGAVIVLATTDDRTVLSARV